MNLTEKHLQDLRSSGLSDETIRLNELRSIDREEATRKLGFDPGCGGLEFPYRNANSPGGSYARIKPDKPFKDASGRPAKYLSAKDSGNRLYIPACYSEKHLIHSKDPIIITEGEKKTLKGAQELPGFVVLGLPGVWCFRNKETGIIDDFKKIDLKDRAVYICYDSDVVTKLEVRQAEFILASELYKKGADVHICRFPQN